MELESRVKPATQNAKLNQIKKGIDYYSLSLDHHHNGSTEGVEPNQELGLHPREGGEEGQSGRTGGATERLLQLSSAIA